MILHGRHETTGINTQVVRRLVLVLAQLDPHRLLGQILLAYRDADFLAIARSGIFLKMNLFLSLRDHGLTISDDCSAFCCASC